MDSIRTGTLIAIVLAAFPISCNTQPLELSLGDGGGGTFAKDGGARDLASTCPPASDPADRAITIVARNDTKSDRYVVGASCKSDEPICDSLNYQGTGACMTFGISRGGALIPLAQGIEILCEGPAPPSTSPGGMHRLAPGASVVVGSWSGRALELCTAPFDCATVGWPQLGIIQSVNAYQREVAPGAYTAVVPVESSLPADCKGGPDDFACGPTPDFEHPQIAPLCKTSSTASADFTLAATGDATVVVPIVD